MSSGNSKNNLFGGTIRQLALAQAMRSALPDDVFEYKRVPVNPVHKTSSLHLPIEVVLRLEYRQDIPHALQSELLNLMYYGHLEQAREVFDNWHNPCGCNKQPLK